MKKIDKLIINSQNNESAKHNCVALKIMDDRGIESLKIVEL
jgi:hypothetical protein